MTAGQLDSMTGGREPEAVALAVTEALAGDLWRRRDRLAALWSARVHGGPSSTSQVQLTNTLAALDAALDHTARAVEWLGFLQQSGPRTAAARHTLQQLQSAQISSHRSSTCRVRIAIVSLLFNWPSTGGGIIHTVELTRFLQAAGDEVELIHPVLPEWGIGQVEDTCLVSTTPLVFTPRDWTIPGSSDLLRMQASECLCPLHNLRLRPAYAGGFEQCPHSPPATPHDELRRPALWALQRCQEVLS